MMSNTFPKTRFKEFKEPWVSVRLSEILHEISSGWSPQCESRTVEGSEWGVLTTTSTTWDGFDEKQNKKLPECLSPRENLRVNEGDILITRAGPANRVAVVCRINEQPKYNLMLSDKLIRIITNKNVDNRFLAVYLKQSLLQNYFSSRKSGLAEAQSNISQDIIKKAPLALPDLKEQEKIADFLSVVDKKISLLKEKHALLEQYKKGVMQQLFSQEIRFKDENGNDFPDWKKSNLGEHLIEYKRRSKTENEHEVLTSSRKGLMKQSDYYSEGRITERSNKGFNVIPENYITFRSRSDDRKFFFNLNTLGITGVISTYYPVFRMVNDQNGFFIELTRYHKNVFGKYAVGTSQVVLSTTEFLKIKLEFPCSEEQKKISDFAKELDKKIALLSQHVEQTQTFKKGLLQQMFV
jgi:type I restriction enzyme S subunit